MDDGTNYPGQDNSCARKACFEDGLRRAHRKLGPEQTILLEYKLFEPAFYHTDIADWGMAWAFARKSGRKAKVLMDTGHHYAAQNLIWLYLTTASAAVCFCWWKLMMV